jgi:hypothetical protein
MAFALSDCESLMDSPFRNKHIPEDYTERLEHSPEIWETALRLSSGEVLLIVFVKAA